MKIGITGATGQLGRLVVEKLKQRIGSDQIIALVRSPEKAADLGVQVREFDYTKPEVLIAGLQGVDRLLLISGNEVGKREEQHKNIIDAAKQVGLKWLAYTSLLRADKSSMILAQEHVQTEQMLKASGIPHVILRNGWYTENYTSSIPGSLQAGSFMGSAADGKISSATREDFAEAAAVVLTSEGHIGKTYELAGDDYYTLNDLAQEVSRQVGKHVPYTNLSAQEFAEVLISLDVPKEIAHFIANMDIGASKGDLFDESKTLSQLIGRPTTPFSEVVKRELA